MVIWNILQSGNENKTLARGKNLSVGKTVYILLYAYTDICIVSCTFLEAS